MIFYTLRSILSAGWEFFFGVRVMQGKLTQTQLAAIKAALGKLADQIASVPVFVEINHRFRAVVELLDGNEKIVEGAL